ncbi:uncharacterized protein PV09_08032 [Verruconis gallopava]|uniref:F-box domain-containing protein n=1 Tax=Verruconis gallopava TaxID=253628 RepID=A0A0D1XEE1_9PEZI|nr:uncharacterized protein PV09_08032 [Verruconis gallopava]KIW00516.1 hypothetical protein PV09_08032 [Verruconis gallopava]
MSRNGSTRSFPSRKQRAELSRANFRNYDDTNEKEDYSTSQNMRCQIHTRAGLQRDSTFFPFLSLPPEIRNIIYQLFFYSYCKDLKRNLCFTVRVDNVTVEGRKRSTHTIVSRVSDPDQHFEFNHRVWNLCRKMFQICRQIRLETQPVFASQINPQVLYIFRSVADIRETGRFWPFMPHLHGHFQDYVETSKSSKDDASVKEQIQKWMWVINAFLRAAGRSYISPPECSDWVEAHGYECTSCENGCACTSAKSDLDSCLLETKRRMIEDLDSMCLRWPGASGWILEQAELKHSLGWSVILRLGKVEPNRWCLVIHGDLGRLAWLYKHSQSETRDIVQEEIGRLDAGIADWLRAINL